MKNLDANSISQIIASCVQAIVAIGLVIALIVTIMKGEMASDLSIGLVGFLSGGAVVGATHKIGGR